jgi:hypothetical protein
MRPASTEEIRALETIVDRLGPQHLAKALHGIFLQKAIKAQGRTTRDTPIAEAWLKTANIYRLVATKFQPR